MTTHSSFRRGGLLASLALLLIAGAQAQTVSGSTSGTFVNPQPGTAVTTGVDTNCFTWGTPYYHGGTPNQLIFDGSPFASLLGEEFNLGTLRYYNGTVVAGTEATSVDLRLAVNFTNPAAGGQNSTFLFNLLNTPNVGTTIDNADYVYFPSTFGVNSFTINGTNYDFQLTGFRNVAGDGFLASDSSRFYVTEGGTASAQLYGRVTARVPEPGTLALALLAVPAVIGLRRRK